MTALTAGDLQARVDRGIEWLDQHHPDWPELIDTNRLDISSPCRCILGQLLGNFDMDEAGLTYDQAVNLGFDIEEMPTLPEQPIREQLREAGARLDDEYRRITDVWRQAIRARRAVPPDRP